MDAKDFLGGAALGAGLMFVLDPDRGRRRRAFARDKAIHLVKKSDLAIQKIGRDMENRAHGAWAEARSMFGDEEAFDDVLVARVRSAVGRAVLHPSAIEVSASQGRVTLSGPVLAHEVDHLLKRAGKVRGVTEIVNRLEPHERPDGISALQGAPARHSEHSELMQENWSPAIRFVAGLAGGLAAIYGFKHHDVPRSILGTLGAAVAARAISNYALFREHHSSDDDLGVRQAG